MAATNKRQEVALPYRRGFITDTDLPQSVADVMAEFNKLEVAIDELMRLSQAGGDPAAIEALKAEIKKIWDAINNLSGTNMEDINKQVEEVKKQLDAISLDDDALTKKLSEFLREDISNAQDEVVNQLLKETNEAREMLKETQTTLNERLNKLNQTASEVQDKWDNIGLSEESIQGIKDALDSDLAEKIKAGDELVMAQLSAFQQVVAEQESATAKKLEGIKSQTNTNKAEIDSMKQTMTTDKESTAQKIDSLETKYTNVNDTANQAFQEAKKAGELAANSTNYMKTYSLSTSGAAPEAAVAFAAPEFFGIKELREDSVLATAKPQINLVVINRKTQERTGAYSWQFEDGNDVKWINDFNERVASFDRDYLQMVFTYQYVGKFLPQLADALVSLGGTKAGIESVKPGGSYALLGYATLASGKAMEHVSSPEQGGKISVTTSMYRDQLTGLDGFTSTQFQEIEDRINSQAERFEKEVQLANTRITDESKARSDAMGALATKVEGVEAKANFNESAIKEQSQAQADALKAMTEQISGAESRIGDTISKVTELESTVATKLDTAVQKVEAMDSRVADNEAKIQEESSTRATAIQAVSEQVAAMQSTVNNNNAEVQSLKKTVTDSTSSLAQRINVKNLNGATITGSNINGGNISGTNIKGGTLNINNRFISDANGNITIQDQAAANRGLKIRNNSIELWDNNGVRRVQISL